MLHWSPDWMDSLEWPKQCKMEVFGTSNVMGVIGQCNNTHTHTHIYIYIHTHINMSWIHNCVTKAVGWGTSH
jgi:hypothetical protein